MNIGINKLDNIDPSEEYFEIKKIINHETINIIPKK